MVQNVRDEALTRTSGLRRLLRRVIFADVKMTREVTAADECAVRSIDGDKVRRTQDRLVGEAEAEALATAFKLLGEPNRLRMLHALSEAGELCVCDLAAVVQLNGKGGVVMDFDHEGGDDMFRDAVAVVIQSRKASTSLLQRKLRVGYSRAARIMEEMEEQGIIGPADGARPREVLISSMAELDGPGGVDDDAV